MASLSLRHIFKAYFLEGKEKNAARKEGKPPYFLAVKDFNMEVKNGEFVVFVGPSGCGKSTTLRMIAGLEEISQGELYIGDRLVNDVASKDRNIAMVFQNYALYPHLTCYENIAFALKMRKYDEPLYEETPTLRELEKEIRDVKKEIKRLPGLDEEAYKETKQEIETCQKAKRKPFSLHMRVLSLKLKLRPMSEETKAKKAELEKKIASLEEKRHEILENLHPIMEENVAGARFHEKEVASLTRQIERLEPKTSHAYEAKLAELQNALKKAKEDAEKEKLDHEIKSLEATIASDKTKSNDHEMELLKTKLETAKRNLENAKSKPIQKHKSRNYTKEEIDQRVRNVATILDITSQLQKKPGAMSGGQRQRVALGRALVRNPEVFLLDEPLSNLDAKLRSQMRVEITQLHERLGTTFIYVTHDQIEAMTMGDRIVVMKLGVVQQIDTPTNLFDYPANIFVASFIGTPQMNFYRGFVSSDGKNTTIEFENGEKIVDKKEAFKPFDPAYLTKEKKPVIIGVRAEHTYIDNSSPFKAKLSFVESLGLETIIYASFEKPMQNYLKTANPLVIKIPERTTYKQGETVGLRFIPHHIHLFNAETEKSIVLKPETTAEDPSIRERFKETLKNRDAEEASKEKK